MRRERRLWLVAVLACVVVGVAVVHFARAQNTPAKEPTRQAIVWTSGDPEVAHKMVLMYVHASQKQGWFDRNLVIVWGPSSRLLAADKQLQAKVKAMMDDGVKFQACQACADLYGVTPRLRELGLEVKYMGQPLSSMLQDEGWEVMTF